MKGKTVQVNCKRCGQEFTARIADRKRGWGKFCSKSCKAINQEKRTHQCADYHERKKHAYYANKYGGSPQFNDKGEYEGFTGGFSNES